MNTTFVPSYRRAGVSLAIIFALVGSPVASAADSGRHFMVEPGDLKWSDVPSLPRGAKIAVIEGPMNEAVPFTARLRFPASYRIPPHWHPAVERVTVLSGTFYMGTGNTLDMQDSMSLAPGSVMILQARTHHYAWTREAVEVQLHGTGPWGITYVNPADDPRQN